MPQTQILDGKFIAKEFEQNLAKKIAEKGVMPFLAVVLVGDNEASEIYVRNKKNHCQKGGIQCEIFRFEQNARETEIITLIDELNANPQVNGIIVQLPLPKEIDVQKVLERVCPAKDVDGFHSHNAGLLVSGYQGGFVPATPLGIMYLLQSQNINLCGKHAVIIGASQIVGRPVATELLNAGCSVSVVHDKTEEIKNITRTADILVVACGCPKLVKKDWIKENAVVIDVGINRENGKICGDADFEDLQGKAALVTPVPGGVGPMTIAMLLQNTWTAYLNQNKF